MLSDWENRCDADAAEEEKMTKMLVLGKNNMIRVKKQNN